MSSEAPYSQDGSVYYHFNFNINECLSPDVNLRDMNQITKLQENKIQFSRKVLIPKYANDVDSPSTEVRLAK